jgi:hypothetical protein
MLIGCQAVFTFGKFFVMKMSRIVTVALLALATLDNATQIEPIQFVSHLNVFDSSRQGTQTEGDSSVWLTSSLG